MSQPRISVITPVADPSPFLERTLCSVLDQGYDNLEHIVVDGGACAEHLDVLRLYEDDLSCWTSQPAGSVPDLINRGLARATGDVVAVLECGDLYLPGALHAVAEAVAGRPAGTWLVGHVLRIDAGDRMLGRISAAAPRSAAAFLMHDSGVLPTASSFLGRDLLAAHGRFEPAMRHAYMYEYCCRLLTAGHSPAILPQTIAAQRATSVVASPEATVRQGLERIAAARRHAQRLPVTDRYALWMNCDLRQRIYTLAQAEMLGPEARRFMAQQLFRRPWWLTDQTVRQTLLHGVAQPAPRRAAGFGRAAA